MAVDDASPLLLMSANAFWNIANFRTGLIRSLVATGYRVRIAAPDSDAAWAARLGVETTQLPIDRSGLNPFRDACLYFNFRELFRRYRPEFFLGFTAKPNIYGTLAARMGGARALPNVSGLGTAFMSDGLLSQFVGALYRLAFRHCRIVFFQNPDDRDLFVGRRIVRPEQARLLPGSGVDLERFTPPAAEPAEICFLFVGRVLGDKGVREFVEASRQLRGEHPDWKFQLLGPIDEGNRTGISPQELEQWVADGIIEYLGETDDVRPFLARASAVVLPSYREGLPRSLLEAAAMARPLIATDVPGCRHVVRHGVNGLLCKVRDAASLAEAMRRLGVLSAAERNAMGRAGRELVEREFSEQRVIDAYLEALGQLRAERGVGLD